MTVQELYNELGREIEQGHGDLSVIANCEFTAPWDCKKGEYIEAFYFTKLNEVYYQSGDIELGFSYREEEQ